MTKPAYVAERQAPPGAAEAEARPQADSEAGRLLASALTAALLEYRRQLPRQLPRQGNDVEAGGPAVEWRMMTRWEQMVPPARNGGQGRA